jgi:hypothetical protein
MLLPTTFPMAISYSPFLVAVIDVTSSGRDVPNAIIVNAINFSLTPIAFAIDEALSTTRLLQSTIDTIPITVNKSAFFNDIYFSSWSTSILFLAIFIK